MKPLAVVMLATLALAARSSTRAGTPVTRALARAPAVVIQTFGFQPKQLEVSVGTRVVWSNNDEIEHTVTALADSGTAPRFSGVLAGKGKTFSFTFDRAGTFEYQCARHTFMRGAIRVTPKGDR